MRLPIAKSKPWQAKPPAPPPMLHSAAGTQRRNLLKAVRLKGEGIRPGSWKLNDCRLKAGRLGLRLKVA